MISEFDCVRVVRLSVLDRHFTGSKSVVRPPAVGDIGVVCHDYNPRQARGAVAVEMIDKNGMTVWLADFDRDELERVDERDHPAG